MSFVQSIGLSDEGSFQDHFSFFVSLVVFGGEFVNPAEFSVAVFAGDIADDVPPRQHDPLLCLTV